MSISEKVSTCFNSRYTSELEALLNNIKGLSDADKKTILDGTRQELVSSSDIQLDKKLLELKEELKEEVTKKDIEIANAVKRKEEQANYDPQEAKEGFTINEVKVTSKVEVTNQSDYRYNPNKKQNILKVYIDKIKNILSINRDTGQVDLIHNSGSYIRVDGNGNVTEYITGNYKRVIEGSYTEEIRGGKCVTVYGDNYEDLKAKDSRTVKGSRKTVVKGGDSLDGTLKVTKAITALDTITAEAVIQSKEDVLAEEISLKYHKHTTVGIGSPNTIPMP